MASFRSTALSLALPLLGSAQVKIACVGDSITAGSHASTRDHAYPEQLQHLLDATHGEGAYNVTNLGRSGTTMLKKSNKPYWNYPEYQELVAGKWEIVTIMLGTNDAKDAGLGGHDNWQHDCGGVEHTTLDSCSFATDYKAMIDVIKTLGTTSAGPKIYAMIPVPEWGPVGGLNRTVINSVFPKLVPMILKGSTGVLGPVDLFSEMGGVPDWQSKFPETCTLNSTFAPCQWWCDEQSCDQCHPNDVGYARIARLIQSELGLAEASSTVVV